MGSLSNKKIVFVIAPKNFRDEEYFQPKVVLQAKGAVVKTAAIGDPEEVTGTKGGKARPDIDFDSISSDNYDAVVFVGGEGAKVYFEDEFIKDAVLGFVENNKVLAAICIAPTILTYAGVLKGKTVTSTESEKESLEKAGAKWSGSEVEVDGLIITANGPDAALKFGAKIEEVLIK